MSMSNPCDEYLTRRRYLTLRAILAGASPFLAVEAVATTAIEEGWDLDERRTWEQWEAGS